MGGADRLRSGHILMPGTFLERWLLESGGLEIGQATGTLAVVAIGQAAEYNVAVSRRDHLMASRRAATDNPSQVNENGAQNEGEQP
jgi:hypothetical protein